MHERILFSGAGGQGLMFIGKLFAHLMMDKVPFLTLIPSYGAEVRGGTSNCQVVLASHAIASPIVEEADALLLMNQPSVDRFLPLLAPDGIAFINSSMAADPGDARAVLVPATELAYQAGNLQAANVVLFGAFLNRKNLLPRETVEAGLREAGAARGAKVVAVNIAALRKGWDYAPSGTDTAR